MNNTVNWSDYGLSGDHLPTNWQHVVSLTEGGWYEWVTLHAFYSPTSRRYFWDYGSGCSCNYWGMDLLSETDFANGSKDDLIRAIRRFGDHYDIYGFRPSDIIDAVSEVRAWRPTKTPS